MIVYAGSLLLNLGQRLSIIIRWRVLLREIVCILFTTIVSDQRIFSRFLSRTLTVFEIL